MGFLLVQEWLEQYPGDTEFHGEALCSGGCVRHNRHASEEITVFSRSLPQTSQAPEFQALKTGSLPSSKNIYHGSPAASRDVDKDRPDPGHGLGSPEPRLRDI